MPIFATGRADRDDAAVLVDVMGHAIDDLMADLISKSQRRLLAAAVLSTAGLTELVMLGGVDAEQLRING